MDGKTPNTNRRHAAMRIMKSLRDITMSECICNKSVRFGLSVVSPEKDKEPKMFITEQNEVRNIVRHITTATIRYLTRELQISDYIHMPFHYRDSINIIKKMIHLNNNNNSDENTGLLNSVMHREFDFQKQDVLTYFRIQGFAALCSKPDLCGFYSRGNSLDIVELFHILKPILKEMNTSTYHSIYGGITEYSMYLIFRICAETPNTRVQGVFM